MSEPDQPRQLDRGITHDNAEHRKLAQTAEYRLAELENLYQAAPIGLAFVDTELRFVRINGSLAALHGLPAVDHIGRSLAEVLPLAVVERVEPLYRQVI